MANNRPKRIFLNQPFTDFVVQTNGLLRFVFFALALSLAASAKASDEVTGGIPDLPENIEIVANSLAPPSPAGEKPFTRMESREIGIYRPVEFSIKDFWPPFWNGRGVSSGDIDRDGDDDIVLGSSDRGVHIFENLGDGTFKDVTPDMPLVKTLPIIIAALVDIDNDGWLDIFTTAYRTGNRILWNEQGRFSEDRMSEVKNRDDAVLTKSLAFGDIDKDGDVDAFVGNWAAGWHRRIPGPEATNRLILNDNGEMTGKNSRELSGMPGETLSVLLSDIDLNGTLDLLVGNDFVQPDIFYLGDGKGGFTQIHPDDGIIPQSTTTTMAMKTGDLDNDLIPEIYIAQISGRADGFGDRMMLKSANLYCSSIDFADDRVSCDANVDLRFWYSFGGHMAPVSEAERCAEGTATFEAECRAMLIKDLAIQLKDPSVCGYISKDQPRTAQLCDIHFRPTLNPTDEQYSQNIAQIQGRNVLLKAEGGVFHDKAEEWNLGVGGFSWDVKLADLDLDEYQDVYVTNGVWQSGRVISSNVLLTNHGEGQFKDETEASGLTEFLILPSVTAIDHDNDGDQDLIGQAVNGPVMLFLNNAQAENRIVFRFDDQIGNRSGVGNKIAIHYGPDGEKHQLREIQSGGGFLSFDSAKAFFGLGDTEEVAWIDIEWSTGEKMKIEGPFAAGSIYTIGRSQSPL